MQELTRLWHRCEVSICRWEDGLNRFTWHRGATNLQFVKKKKQYLWIPTIWEKTNHSICENEVCLYCIAGVSKSLMKIPITHIHTPHSGCRVRVQASGPRLGACALWWPHRSFTCASFTSHPPQAWTDPPEHSCSCRHSNPELTLRLMVLLRDLGYYQHFN